MSKRHSWHPEAPPIADNVRCLPGIKRGDLCVFSSMSGTGRSLVAEHAARVAHLPLTDEQIRLASIHDRLEALAFPRFNIQPGAQARFFEADFEKIERRVVASLGGDRRKDSKIQEEEGAVNPVDIHKNRAAELFDVPVDEVTDAQRDFARCYSYMEHYGYQGNFADYLKSRGLPPPIEEQAKD